MVVHPLVALQIPWVEKDERSVDVPSMARTPYDNRGKQWEIGRV